MYNNQMYHPQQWNHPMEGDIQSQCQKYMNYHVIAQMNDGLQFDGIIESMDNDGVTMFVAEEVDQVRQEGESEDARQFGYGGYGGYGGQPYGRRYRRYHRRRFPFASLNLFFPFPYYPWYW